EKLERSLEELVSENAPYGAYYQNYIIDNAISA
ncbi:MAG: hypothetical protein CFH43_00640, partial [Proteobacteria bacterium]